MLKEEIKNRCLEDIELFTEICRVTKKTPNTGVHFLYRNTSDKLRSYEVLQVIKKHTGLTEQEILTPLPTMMDNELLESDVHNKK